MVRRFLLGSVLSLPKGPDSGCCYGVGGEVEGTLSFKFKSYSARRRQDCRLAFTYSGKVRRPLL